MSLFDALKASLVLLSAISLIFLLLLKALSLIVLDIKGQVLPDLVDSLVVGPVAEHILQVSSRSCAGVVNNLRVGPVYGEEVSVYFPPVVDSRVVEGGVASPGPAVGAHAVLPAQCEVTSLSSLISHLMRRLRRALLSSLQQHQGRSHQAWSCQS